VDRGHGIGAPARAVRGNLPDQYRAYAKVSNEQSERLLTIRGLFRLKSADEDGRKPVPIEEVEPAKDIVPAADGWCRGLGGRRRKTSKGDAIGRAAARILHPSALI
jgi:hypothetical protein